MTNHYYKSLDELRRESRELADRRRLEFAEPLPWKQGAEAPPPPSTTRRDFLALMGFSLGAAACSRAPVRKAIPLLTATEEMTPGVANWYATTCGGCPSGCGLLVKTRDGRPIKVEGNAESPLSGGGTCAVGQATVLSLYDEQRLRGPLWQGQRATWDEVDQKVQERLQATIAARRPVVLLTGTLLGPATRDLVARWSRHYPGFRHVVYEPASASALRQAWQESYGRAVVPHPRFDRAALVVGLEADFLGTWLSPVEFTRHYARRRQPSATMARHVQFESGLSLTGANADERHAVGPAELGRVALGLLRGVQALAAQRAVPAPDAALGAAGEAVGRLARELWRHAGESLVLSGSADVAVQVLVAALNHELGNVGRTLDLARPSLQAQADDREMARLVDDMNQGQVQALLLYGVNPAYDYPEAERFVQGLERAALTVSFADRLDETAARVHAVCPDHHFLEAWGDAEPVASSLGLAQPTLAPLFDTRAAQESLLKWMGERPDFHAYLREHWRREFFPRQQGSAEFEAFWSRTLQAGFLELASDPEPLPPFAGDVERAAARVDAATALARAHRDAGRFELHLYQTVGLRDGRHANNPWLQELPDPVTKLTWGHAAAVAPAVATRLGLEDGDVVALGLDGLRLELPVCVQPGQSAGCVSVALGYGRTQAGPVAKGIGVNAYPWATLVAGARRGAAAGLTLEKTGRRQALAATQTHHEMEGRDLVREATLAAFLADPAAGNRPAPELPSLWGEKPETGPTWGMAIDLGSCTGCSACVVACQAENNVPVVGRDEVRRGREMHWIRIDRYYSGPPEDPRAVFQPVMCQHCAHAPCETVCPVLATVRSDDGLNQQVYNRCIGTRYCENNCPYKVRRFNWFAYAQNPRFDFHLNSPLGSMVLNPDVVTRSRGVMEKCSLCVQRIQEGRLAASQRGRPLADGDIRTACQQACPAQAIVFGDLADPQSQVARLAHGPRHYHLLGSVGTRPGVGYLTKVRRTDA
jgi:Fe-S-cluster-containing dehydrogenase component/anaerobic selenocysteine-containing dehydrogenase